MKQFYRNQADVSAKTGKKGRKLKKNHSVEACKCFAPFVKLHWWDCPEVNKPCPIHGNIPYQNVRPEKVDPDQSVTVAFHPSSRTEKLLQPVKSLLALCDPETRINFQYFSPRSFTDKENLKHQTIQTSFEDLSKATSNSYFVEKKKSSINEKTNRMKKLKERFHSSYNAIVQKYPATIPVKPDLNEISQEESSTQPWQNFFSGDTQCGQSSEWLSSNPFGFEKLERLTSGKRDSDFITITQHDKGNVISHKIFEIDPGKGFNDNGFPRQSTQFAYSSLNVNPPDETKMDSNIENFELIKETEELKEPKESTKESGESKKSKKPKKDKLKSKYSQMSTSSAGSIYVTPFFLMPPGVELESDTEFEEVESGKRNVAVQVNEGEREEKPKLVSRYVQYGDFNDTVSEPKTKTVSVQTDPKPGTYRRKYTGYITTYDSSEDTMSEKFSYNEKLIQTNIRDNVRVDTSTVMEDSNIKTTEVQTSNRYQIKEVLITRYNKPTREAANQAQSSTFILQESVSLATNKPLMTKPSFVNKTTQYPDSLGSEKYELIYDVSSERMCKYYSDSESDRRREEKPKNKNINASSSKSPERFKTYEKPPGEEKPSGLSDLSELKRMIYEYFERATCHCKERENQTNKKNRSNMATMTDGSKSQEKKDKMVSMQMQTTETISYDKAIEAVPTQLIGGPQQYRQSVLLDDPNQNKTNYICSFCGRRINKFSMNASTNTDESCAIEEKTTIIETDFTEITKVKKTADPRDPSRKSMTTSKKQTVKPITYYRTDSQKVMKTVQAQTSPVRSNIPIPVPVTQTKSERQKEPPSSRDVQEWSTQSSQSTARRKPSAEKQRLVPQTFRECHCDEDGELFLSLQDSKYSPKSGMDYKDNRPEDGNSPGRQRDELKEKRDIQKKSQKRQFYYVSINPSWPKEFVSSWNSHQTTDESPRRRAKQKAASDKDEPLSDAYSVKNFDESRDICEIQKQKYSDSDKSRKHETQKVNNFRFVRMPSSSASQISINKGALFQSKVIKSEESVKTVTQQLGYTPGKIFGDDPNDLFTVKSCHLNPITIAYGGQNPDKILACSVCKSVVLLKGYKNDDLTYVSGANDEFQYHNVQSGSEEKIPTDDYHERNIYDKFTLVKRRVDEQEEEYIEKHSDYSDTTTRTIENDFCKEENTDSDS